MKKSIGSFPFGQPVLKVIQTDRTQKKVFVLGVYASAVHAQWIGPDKKMLIRALAVASEPEIFWRGENAKEIIKGITIPEGAGRLVPAAKNLNGPSGLALDKWYLKPLGLVREDAWLCDLVPHSCLNSVQKKAIYLKYNPNKVGLHLPDCTTPDIPETLADESRCNEILEELKTADTSVIITLGDQPLKWFTSKFGSKSRLVDYGKPQGNSYGLLHDIMIDGRAIKLLPLVHPRQAGRLGGSSPEWAECHDKWIKSVASGLLRG
jgi:uracil-DNA glycosylase